MDYFTHFCKEHVFMLAVITIVITAGLIFFSKLSEKAFKIALRVIATVLVLAEAILVTLLIRDGETLLNCLPLHLCNIGIFINLTAAFTRGKVQSFFAEISLVLNMPGAIGALLFPDWTYKPFWSYIPMFCFFTHTLLVFIPLLLLVRGKTHVTFKHFWYPCLFLLVACPPIGLLDSRLEMNYMFLRYPPDDSPLEWIYNRTGDKYYVLGLIIVTAIFLVIEYAVYGIMQRCIQKQKATHKNA